MRWNCPACLTEIRLDAHAPEPKRVYRCHVCRLELGLDERTNMLKVMPLPVAPEDDPPRQ